MTAVPPDFRVASPVRSYGWVAAIGAVALIASFVATLGASAAGLWIAGAAVYALVCALIARGLLLSFPHPVLGLCNIVTQLRLGMVTFVAIALTADPSPSWIVFALSVVIFALDGVDGWLARREGLVSTFGARFDMEVDSAFALVLALAAFASGAAGALVLLLGLARYLFWAATLALPWLGEPLPDRFSRKLVCVGQIATLVALQAPAFPAALGSVAILATVASLFWSFGVDIRWQWRAQHRATKTA